MLPVQLVGQRSAERSGRLQVSECCLCSWLAGDAQSGPVDCSRVNAACAASWLEKCREGFRFIIPVVFYANEDGWVH
jgi:hypothetical protein